MNPKVDQVINKSKNWLIEIEKLRMICLECELSEELKWGKPCYAFKNSNVVIIQGFKKYCALLFFKGVLLKDPNNILIKTGENTRVGRQIRFQVLKEIESLEPVLVKYIKNAIEIEKAGLKVEPPEKKEMVFPEEFKKRLSTMPTLKKAFDSLTPGRQRAYNIHFSQPKQSKTREARIEKCIPKIIAGLGFNDRVVK